MRRPAAILASALLACTLASVVHSAGFGGGGGAPPPTNGDSSAYCLPRTDPAYLHSASVLMRGQSVYSSCRSLYGPAFSFNVTLNTTLALPPITSANIVFLYVPSAYSDYYPDECQTESTWVPNDYSYAQVTCHWNGVIDTQGEVYFYTSPYGVLSWTTGAHG